MYLLKFKTADEYSLRDIERQTLSFASFDCFKGQGELLCVYDYKRLKTKYNDNSLTKTNALTVLTNHCFKRYCISSFSIWPPFNSEMLNHMWKTYSGNKGFSILYSFTDIIDYSLSKNNPFLLKVHYENNYCDLTELFDRFLSAAIGFDNEWIITQRFIQMDNMRRMRNLIFYYFSQKTKYEYPFEKEVRLVYVPYKEDALINKHVSISFVKPVKIYMLSDVENGYKDKIKALCLFKNIKYEEINSGDTLEL